MAKRPTPNHSSLYDAEAMAAIRQLKAGVEEDAPRIGYEVFVSKYLPLLAAPLERDEQGYDIPRDMSFWLEVCRNPSNPVHVMDTTTGNIRYTVPPMVGGVKTYFAQPRASLHEISSEAERKARMHPRMGVAYLEEGLKGRLKNQTTINQEALAMWNRILTDHGYPTLGGEHKPTTAKATPESPLPEPTEDDFTDI